MWHTRSHKVDKPSQSNNELSVTVDRLEQRGLIMSYMAGAVLGGLLGAVIGYIIGISDPNLPYFAGQYILAVLGAILGAILGLVIALVISARERTASYKFGSFLMALGLLGIPAGFFIDLILSLVAALLVLVGLVIRRRA
jgi:hypothetical protein